MSGARSWTARKLLRAAHQGSLATAAAGLPFASLVTPATAPDLSVLLLLSDLAEHTKHLRAEPNCALLVLGPPVAKNPQTTPRVAVSGVAELANDPELRSRYLAIHPYAAMYADFADFHLWRIRPASGLFVGGFAQAARLGAAELTADPAATAAIQAAGGSIMDEWNQTRSDVLARMAGEPGPWRIAALDVDGCHLAQGEHVLRLDFPTPVVSEAELRRELARFAGGD